MLIQSNSKYLRSEDINEGDIVKFLDEGEIVHNEKFNKDEFMIKVELDNGEEKLMRMNNTSKQNIAGRYGKDTADWKNKHARVNKVEQYVSGKMRTVVILTDPAKDVEGNIVV